MVLVVAEWFCFGWSGVIVVLVEWCWLGGGVVPYNIYLLSKLHELGELVVYLVREGGLARGGGAHVLAVARRQLGGHVGVTDLQRQRQLPRARLYATLVVAFEPGEIVIPLNVNV